MFLPGAVDGRDGVSIGASVVQESKEIISGNNTWWDNINEGHGSGYCVLIGKCAFGVIEKIQTGDAYDVRVELA